MRNGDSEVRSTLLALFDGRKAERHVRMEVHQSKEWKSIEIKIVRPDRFVLVTPYFRSVTYNDNKVQLH
jgi:hypothetical protein